jgi:hypothetical protein
MAHARPRPPGLDRSRPLLALKTWICKPMARAAVSTPFSTFTGDRRDNRLADLVDNVKTPSRAPTTSSANSSIAAASVSTVSGRTCVRLLICWSTSLNLGVKMAGIELQRLLEECVREATSAGVKSPLSSSRPFDLLVLLTNRPDC